MCWVLQIQPDAEKNPVVSGGWRGGEIGTSSFHAFCFVDVSTASPPSNSCSDEGPTVCRTWQRKHGRGSPHLFALYLNMSKICKVILIVSFQLWNSTCRHRESRNMPMTSLLLFGLHGVPAIFQWLMDDVIIHSHSWEYNPYYPKKCLWSCGKQDLW